MVKMADQNQSRPIFFLFSLLIALGYGLVYHRHEIGVSPFHFSARLPGVDMIVLLISVVLPLVLGLTLGVLSGPLRWWVLPIYPVVIVLSLV